MENLKGELSSIEEGVIVEAVDLLIERLSAELGVSRYLVEVSLVREVEASIYTANRTRPPGTVPKALTAGRAKTVPTKALTTGRPRTAKGRKHAPRALLQSRNP